MEVTEHPNCPTCKEGIGELHIAVQEDIKMGRLPKGTMPATEIHVHVNVSASKPPIIGGRVPALREYRDICEQCGTVWSFRVERGHATYTGDMRQLFKDFR